MKTILKRIIRGGTFLLNYLFVEKPKGLDFSLRQKNMGISNSWNHGYALTQEKAFDDMLRFIDIEPDDCFIDIGCGKGGCLKYAKKYGFKRIAGIEIERSLYEIAVRNFNILQMNVELYNCDATRFDKYGEFNFFYFFNPFDEDIYKEVLDNIFKSIENKRRVYLLLYGASAYEYVEGSGVFELVSRYTDGVRGTAVNLYRKKQTRSDYEELENEI